MKPDRVVIGTESDKAKEILNRLYAPLVRQGNPIIFMDERSAEMTKYAANAFLATKITFMNEIANLCELVGANVDDIRRGIGTDSRIGKRFLFAGIGYGGSCFPKDVQALAKTSEENNYQFHILDSVMKVNEKQKTKLIPIIKNHFNNDLAGKTIGIWGLAFKPNTNDMREAPSRVVIAELVKRGASVVAHDPVAMPEAKHCLESDFKGNPEGLKKVSMVDNPMAALDACDALVIVTEWKAFRSPDFDQVIQKLTRPIIFDGRNLYEPSAMQELGIEYYGIGRHN